MSIQLHSFQNNFHLFFQIALLALFGGTANYILRSNINIALVEMNNPNNSYGPYVNFTTYQGGDNAEANVKNAAGQVKSAFFLGYVLTGIPAGKLTDVYGAKKTFALTTFLSSLLCSAIPLVSYMNLSSSAQVWAMYAIRMVQGMLQGPLFPSLTLVVNKWSPLSEKGKFISVCYSCVLIGYIITFPMSGLIMEYLSWTWVFYITSLISLVWLLLWLVFMSESPVEDKFIRTAERDYIVQFRQFDGQQDDSNLPLLPLMSDMLKNRAVWVDLLTIVSSDFGLAVIQNEGPDFISKILQLGKDIASNGFYSALPFVLMGFLTPAVGAVADYAVGRKSVSQLNLQRIGICVSHLIPAAGFIGMPYLTSENNQYYCVALLSVCSGFFSARFISVDQNYIGLAPNRSGMVCGVVNGLANIAGFLAPISKAGLVQDDRNIVDWRNYFLFTAGVLALGAGVFSLLATTEVQPFNSKDYRG